MHSNMMHLQLTAARPCPSVRCLRAAAVSEAGHRGGGSADDEEQVRLAGGCAAVSLLLLMLMMMLLGARFGLRPDTHTAAAGNL